MKVNIDKVKDIVSGKVADIVFEDRDEFSWYMNLTLNDKKMSFIVRHKDMKRLVKSI